MTISNKRQIVFPCQLRYSNEAKILKNGDTLEIKITVIECEECDNKGTCSYFTELFTKFLIGSL